MLRWLGHARSAVLDGGFAAWHAAAGRWSSDAAFEPRRYELRQPDRARSWRPSELAARQAAGDLLVDARAAPRYRGEQEPIDPVAGHVPGARNRPFSANVTADRAVSARGRAANASSRSCSAAASRADVIAMCGSGVTACHLLLAMEVAGLGGGRLYAGSWSEWIRDPARPIRTGAEP